MYDLSEYIGLEPKLKEVLASIENLLTNEFDYIKLNINPTLSSPDIGTLSFNSTDGTANLILSTDVTMQIGQEHLIRAVNKTGSTISNGKVVHIVGATGNRPKIELVDITDLNTNCVLGLATENISNNEYGYVCIMGIVRGLNTNGIVEGTRIYASTSGNLTTTIPNDGYRRFWLGIVIKEHINDGWVLVNVHEMEYMFGDVVNGNYSLFESNGVLKMMGTAQVWDDLPPISIISSRLGANTPTLTPLKGNINQLTFAVNDYIESNLEFLHYYKEGSNFDMHLHIVTNGLEAVDKYVKFRVEFTISDGTTGVFPTSTILDKELLIPANTPDRTMFIDAFSSSISGTNVKIGSVLCLRLTRIASSGTAVANNPFAIQLSAHVQKDTLGSRQRFTKN